MKNLYLVIAVIIGVMIGCPSSASAQVSADNYFEKAVKAQQTMTVSSQNLAIKNFQLAKKCYDSEAKKNLCDTQIRTCRNTIKLIKEKEEAVSEEVIVVDKNPKESLEPVEEKPVHVNIKMSNHQINFKAKGGESATINIYTDGHDWQYLDVPDWVTVSSNSSQLVILSQRNETDEDRMGSIKIKSGDSEKQIFISQKSSKMTKLIRKTKNFVTGK